MEAHDPYTFYEMIRHYGNRYFIDLLGIKNSLKELSKRCEIII
jgi:hypothetical protein